MARSSERRHFARIAQAEERLARDSIRAAAQRSPGENIEIGFALSEFAASFGGELHRPPEVSLAAVWRALRDFDSPQRSASCCPQLEQNGSTEQRT